MRCLFFFCTCSYRSGLKATVKKRRLLCKFGLVFRHANIVFDFSVCVFSFGVFAVNFASWNFAVFKCKAGVSVLLSLSLPLPSSEVGWHQLSLCLAKGVFKGKLVAFVSWLAVVCVLEVYVLIFAANLLLLCPFFSSPVSAGLPLATKALWGSQSRLAARVNEKMPDSFALPISFCEASLVSSKKSFALCCAVCLFFALAAAAGKPLYNGKKGRGGAG